MAGRVEISSEGLRLTSLREVDGGRYTCVVASESGYEAESVWLRVEPSDADATQPVPFGRESGDLLLNAYQSDADTYPAPTPRPGPRPPAPPQRTRDPEGTDSGSQLPSVTRDGRRVVLLRATGRTSPNGVTDIVWEVPVGGLTRDADEPLLSFSIQYRSSPSPSASASAAAAPAPAAEELLRQESGWHTLIEGLAPSERRVRAMVPVSDGAMLFRALAFLGGKTPLTAAAATTPTTTPTSATNSHPLPFVTRSAPRESATSTEATNSNLPPITLPLDSYTFHPELEEEPMWDDGSEEEQEQLDSYAHSTTASVHNNEEPINEKEKKNEDQMPNGPTRAPRVSSPMAGRSTSAPRQRRPAGVTLEPFLILGARSELVVHVLGALCLVLFVVLLLVLLLIICTGRRKRSGSRNRRRSTPSMCNLTCCFKR